MMASTAGMGGAVDPVPYTYSQAMPTPDRVAEYAPYGVARTSSRAPAWWSSTCRVLTAAATSAWFLGNTSTTTTFLPRIRSSMAMTPPAATHTIGGVMPQVTWAYFCST